MWQRHDSIHVGWLCSYALWAGAGLLLILEYSGLRLKMQVWSYGTCLERSLLTSRAAS
jgi:hypothetical protein